MAQELRKLILEAEDIQEELVPVPEWGDDVKILVRGMTGKERAQFLRRTSTETGGVEWDRFYPELVITCAHDPEDQTKLFGAADRDALNGKSAAALGRVAEVAQRLSGLGPASEGEILKDSGGEATEKSGST